MSNVIRVMIVKYMPPLGRRREVWFKATIAVAERMKEMREAGFEYSTEDLNGTTVLYISDDHIGSDFVTHIITRADEPGETQFNEWAMLHTVDALKQTRKSYEENVFLS